MALSDKQIEQILTQLEAGEKTNVLLSKLSEEDRVEVTTILDVKDFMEAQSLQVFPKTSGLKEVLSSSVVFEDDEIAGGWGQWMKPFRWTLPATLSFALLLFVFNPLSVEESEQNIVFSPELERQKSATNEFDTKIMQSQVHESMFAETAPMAMDAMDMGFALSGAEEDSSENVDELVRRLGAEFDAELVEYKNLENDLSPYYEENLFSMNKMYNLPL